MPELPEVETVRRGLAEHLQGQYITRALLNRADLRIPFPPNLAEILTNSRIERLDRRAKYLLVHLDNQSVLLAHLGMSGTMVLHPQNAYEARAHDHVLIDLENGLRLVFNDPRRFGLVTLADAATLYAHPLLCDLGPEPLSSAFDAAYLKAALAKRKGPIKQAIMDQKLVVGVGNIYASEALFHARIHPETPSYQAAIRSKVLVEAIQKVLEAAIESGGSTLRDYVRSSGDPGYFQHSFAVYGRADLLCTRCQKPVKHQVQGGRATYFCYKCQPLKK